jgi:hypothetical protein
VKLTTRLHLVPRSKNEWSYTTTPQYAFMVWCLVKHRDNFTFFFTFITNFTENLDSSVSIARDYGLDDRGSRVRFSMGARNFSLHHRVQNGSRAHPASSLMGTTGSFPGCEANHSPASSEEVKNACSYASTTLIRLHGVVLN